MTVRLRAHHLLCMLTYVGKGYSAAFTANFDRICTRLGAGEDILLVEGPDDVCAPLLCEAEPHCHEAGIITRDRLAKDAAAALLARPLEAGARIALDATTLAGLRDAFRHGTSRDACSACEWHDLCSEIAGAGFPDVRLRVG